MGGSKKSVAKRALVAASKDEVKSKGTKKTTTKGMKTVQLQVEITQTHQDDLSWGAYIHLEPPIAVDINALVPYESVYLVELSWTNANVRAPHNVNHVMKGGRRVLQFLLAGPGLPGSKVLVRLRYSPAMALDETVTASAVRLHDMQPQLAGTAHIHHVPGAPHYP